MGPNVHAATREELHVAVHIDLFPAGAAAGRETGKFVLGLAVIEGHDRALARVRRIIEVTVAAKATVTGRPSSRGFREDVGIGGIDVLY
jgi:hypothetical protein